MGYRVREVRKMKRVSQEELAERSGVSRQLISMIEKNKVNASIEKMADLARALNCTLDDIFSL